MKKVGIVLILVMVWLGLKGQTGPVFPYNHPSKQTLRELAREETVKGYVYRKYLVETINLGLKDTAFKVSLSYVDFIFNHIFLEEVYLKEGMYKNSGYNPSTKKMDSSVGHQWNVQGKGFAWVFRVGTYSIVLIKEDCGNILTVPVIRKFVQAPMLSQQPTLIKQDDWSSFQSPRRVVKEQEINPSVLVINQQSEKIGFFKTRFARIGLPIIAVGVGVGTGLLIANWDRSSPLPLIEEGGPVGAPSYPADEDGGPVGSPSYPADGGPVGSQTYGKNFQQPTIGVGIKINF